VFPAILILDREIGQIQQLLVFQNPYVYPVISALLVKQSFPQQQELAKVMYPAIQALLVEQPVFPQQQEPATIEDPWIQSVPLKHLVSPPLYLLAV